MSTRQRLLRFFYFFPFQLVILHLKKNYFALLLWVVLFAFATGSIATKFGIPSLFLYPEYMGLVNIWSYGILGFALGGFIVAFHIYSYVNHSFRFPFLATLSRPFFKFMLNNFIIPLAFLITYIWCSVDFMRHTELLPEQEIWTNIAGFLGGNMVALFIAVLYFYPTNKDVYKITGRDQAFYEKVRESRQKEFRKSRRWYLNRRKSSHWRVETYLKHPFKIGLARDPSHYGQETLRRVFLQNHLNATVFQIAVIITFLAIGAYQDNPFFVIPAAASACLLFTMILMVLTILQSWLKGWTASLIVALLLLINFLSAHYQFFNVPNQAYGLDYKSAPAPYTREVLNQLHSNADLAEQDKNGTIRLLDTWLQRQRLSKGDSSYKPKMLLINTSGGGLRSAMWTFTSLQHIDSLLDYSLMQRTQLLTGSSGGTIGAAYYRELRLRSDSLSPPLSSDEYINRISSDLLNPILLSLATNDIFIRFRSRTLSGNSYPLDRGMVFEQHLNLNTDQVLNKKITDYEEPVQQGKTPMMILSPSVINDGRRMLICSQPISYLTYVDPVKTKQLNIYSENVEFNRFFADYGAEDLQMTTALRMNSTFPYILPNTSLPTQPPVEVMDAGLRDNFGMKISLQYLNVFQDWIEQNTSGVVILQIRDTEKNARIKSRRSSLLQRFTSPINSFYGNYFKDQDFNIDQMLKLAQNSFEVPIVLIPVELEYSYQEQISLSWHLTQLEKQRILRSLRSPTNQANIQRLQVLLE